MMRECQYCNKCYESKDPRGSKFCSLSCSNYYREKNKAVKFRFCKQCNKSFPAQGYTNQKQFCSHSCAAVISNKTRVRDFPIRPKKISIPWKLRKQKIVDDWKLGIVEGHTKYGSIRDPIRLYLLELNNYCCCKCGFSGVNPITNKTILQINHIDGNCMNSTKDNLEVICPNCHSMTPNYGSLNKNSARVWKRAKYNNPLK